jgi:hypothetical protein
MDARGPQSFFLFFVLDEMVVEIVLTPSDRELATDSCFLWYQREACVVCGRERWTTRPIQQGLTTAKLFRILTRTEQHATAIPFLLFFFDD